MKPTSLILTTLLPLSTSQLLVALLPQHQLGQLPIMPPASTSDNNPPSQPAVPLADILGTQRALTTFSSLARQSSDLETLLSSFSINTTVLAPLNSAIEALPRKLWEDPREGGAAAAYQGEQGQERAKANLKRFVEAHLVGVSPWEEGQKGETVGGRKLWWETREDGRRVIMPDGVEVDKVASRVANGELVS